MHNRNKNSSVANSETPGDYERNRRRLSTTVSAATLLEDAGGACAALVASFWHEPDDTSE